MRHTLRVTRWPSWWAFVAACAAFVGSGLIRTCSVVLVADDLRTQAAHYWSERHEQR